MRLGDVVPSAHYKDEEERGTMICGLCGEPIDFRNALIRLTQHVRSWSPRGTEVLAPLRLEDGSKEKFFHPVCLVKNGTPLTALGADGSHADV